MLFRLLTHKHGGLPSAITTQMETDWTHTCNPSGDGWFGHYAMVRVCTGVLRGVGAATPARVPPRAAVPMTAVPRVVRARPSFCGCGVRAVQHDLRPWVLDLFVGWRALVGRPFALLRVKKNVHRAACCGHDPDM